MVIFNSYVSLPEGTSYARKLFALAIVPEVVKQADSGLCRQTSQLLPGYSLPRSIARCAAIALRVTRIKLNAALYVALSVVLYVVLYVAPDAANV